MRGNIVLGDVGRIKLAGLDFFAELFDSIDDLKPAAVIDGDIDIVFFGAS